MAIRESAGMTCTSCVGKLPEPPLPEDIPAWLMCPHCGTPISYQQMLDVMDGFPSRAVGERIYEGTRDVAEGTVRDTPERSHYMAALSYALRMVMEASF